MCLGERFGHGIRSRRSRSAEIDAIGLLPSMAMARPARPRHGLRDQGARLKLGAGQADQGGAVTAAARVAHGIALGLEGIVIGAEAGDDFDAGLRQEGQVITRSGAVNTNQPGGGQGKRAVSRASSRRAERWAAKGA